MTIKLYRHPLSGHAHRAELMLNILHLEHELIDVDLANGEQKSPEYLAINPLGQVPALVDGDTTVTDSNAILVYLATRYDPSRRWLPEDPTLAAEVQRFLTLTAGAIAFGPAAARLVTVFGAGLDHKDALERSETVLQVLEDTLKNRPYLAGPLSIADIAAYAYIAHSPEGGVNLEPYIQVRAWLKRVEALPGFVPMQATPVGLAA